MARPDLGAPAVTIGTGRLVGAVVHFVVAALVLVIADRVLSGFEVKGFAGAMVGAIAIAAVAGVLGWLVASLLHL